MSNLLIQLEKFLRYFVELLPQERVNPELGELAQVLLVELEAHNDSLEQEDESY